MAVSETSPPAGVYLIALSTRLMNNCCKRSRSPASFRQPRCNFVRHGNFFLAAWSQNTFQHALDQVASVDGLDGQLNFAGF